MKKYYFLILLFTSNHLIGIPMYDEGSIIVKGVQFLRDKEDLSLYYYIPQYPRLAVKENNVLELLCMKYVGQGGAETNGGIFHALIEFSLPVKMLEELEEELKKKVGGAVKIAGPVPLQQAVKDGESGLASFQVVSSILTNTSGPNQFTRTIITSGHAPFLPGSKAAISARLSQEGATLLFKSLEGTTSDISITLSGFYEAAVKAYNATVTANSSTIYKHFSAISNKQEGYKKDEIRKIADELIRNQSIKVEVFDRSAALGINAKDMDGVLSMVTDKIINVMFDAKEGWSKDPERVAAVGQDQIPMRQERGFFGKLFAGSGNQAYVSDEQFVLKNIKDTKINNIYINLSKSTTIKVPVYTSGNISGLYKELKNDDTYFKIVNLDDPDFQKRDVVFQLDGEFAETFGDLFNFVEVSIVKKYGKKFEDVTSDIIFDKKSIETGSTLKHFFYPRLGLTSTDWLKYQYRLSWALKGDNDVIRIPLDPMKWIDANSTAVLLSPPFEKRIIEIDSDRKIYKEKNVISASIRFITVINNKPQVYKTVVMKATDVESTNKLAVYSDKGESIGYQVSWFTQEGELKDEIKLLDSDYLVLIPK